MQQRRTDLTQHGTTQADVSLVSESAGTGELKTALDDGFIPAEEFVSELITPAEFGQALDDAVSDDSA